jgi:hypothetical protein
VVGLQSHPVSEPPCQESWGQHAPVPASFGGDRVFWYGVLLAFMIARFLPSVVGIALFVVALFASDLLGPILNHGHFASSDVSVMLLVGLGLVVGLWFGRIRGLRLLGEAEFRTRWRNVLGISRWF